MLCSTALRKPNNTSRNPRKIRFSGASDDNGEALEIAKSCIVAALEELIAIKEVILPKTAF